MNNFYNDYEKENEFITWRPVKPLPEGRMASFKAEYKTLIESFHKSYHRQ